MTDATAACVNTDREIWRGPDEGGGDFYADSLHVTKEGSLGINCGGYVVVKPIREWHRLASPSHEAGTQDGIQSSTVQAETPIGQERIVAAALKIGSMTVSAPPPARHHTLLHAFHACNRKTMIKTTDQGFLTSAGRFVGREEAAKMAVAARQIIVPKFQSHQLFSEDLW